MKGEPQRPQRMANGGLRIATVAGIPLIIHYSWIAIFALITANLAIVFGEPGFHPEWSIGARVGVALVTSILFFVSVLVHELAHSLVSIRYGIPVENITLFIFGGASHISQEADRPGKEAIIAFVGPLTSFILGGLFYAIAWFVNNPYINTGAAWLAIINLALGAFNLLPGFPLDGGRVLRAAVWGITKSFDRATRVAAGAGRFFGFALMFAGGLEIFLEGNLGGLWLVLIGWFLENAAGSSYQQLQLTNALAGVRARDVMDTECPRVPQQLKLDTLVEGYIMPSGRRCFVVTGPDREIGIVTLGGISAVPRDHWRDTSVSDAMVPLEKAVKAAPDTPAIDILNAMAGRNINQVPVVVADQVVGMATRERMLNLVRTRMGMFTGNHRQGPGKPGW